MALFNEILSGRLNRAIQKFTGIKGAPPAPQLSSEFMPIFPFFWGVENRYLESWNRFGVVINFASSAANFNMVQLRNPSNSKLVAVFEKILAANNSGGADAYQLQHGPQTVDFSINTATTRFDARIVGQTSALIVSSRQNPATAGLAVKCSVVALNNTNNDFITTDIQEVPLLPGDAIEVNNTTVNVGSSFTFWWRERSLEESELF